MTTSSIPAELARPGRAVPPWAPSILYLVTVSLLLTVFVVGPGVGAIAAGLLADVPANVKALAILTGILLVGSAPLFVAIVMRRRRVYKFGTLVAATIQRRTEQRIKSGPVRTRLWRYEFTFASSSGATRGKSQADLLVQRRLGFLPDVGDTVFVVYDPARPRRSYAWSYGRAGHPLWVPA